MDKSAEERLRDVEHKLSAIAGVDGVPGWIQRVENEQQRSALSQGQRIGAVETAIEAKIVVLQNEITEIRKSLDRTKEGLIDFRARILAGISIITALASGVVTLLKHLT